MSPDSLLPALPVALLVAAAGAFAMAQSRLLVDRPNARSSHKLPTPRGGGIGLVLGTLAGGWLVASGMPVAAPVAAGATIAALAGLADDARPQGAAIKFGAQFLAAFVAIGGGAIIERLYIPGYGAVELGAFGPALTFLWFVGLTNAYNFMDGLDALAGATGTVAAIFLGLAFLLAGVEALAALAFVLAAACAGFLALNLPPARVFMGDVGSQFLGFAFAGLGVFAAGATTDGRLVWLVPIVLMHFLFDTILTASRRLAAGENVFAAHRTHLYQRLNQAGFPHGKVAALLAAMTAIQGSAALCIDSSVGLAILAPFALQVLYARWVLSRSAAV
ncbi:MAG: undecaprenyl/decaprenyl-phosphate alpha-N-acetylglucosaminyl 1-phosphate transferase [Rhodospirillales bacterium]|nr:undecaprenyl/decaprenyl-phosphate alpha-N-acetylglucosaminyl 1-phosphate transferase [Rhodospirillales bacterium]